MSDENKQKLTKSQRRENYIKQLKRQLEYQKYLNRLMKMNIKNYYISKLDIIRRIDELEHENEIEADIFRQAIILELENFIT